MKIFIVTQDFPPQSGGIQTTMSQLATSFGNEGHEVHVYASTPDEFSEEVFVAKNVTVHRFPRERWRKNKYRYIYDAFESLDLSDSVVLTSYWKLSIPFVTKRKLRGVPVYPLFHGLDAYPVDFFGKLRLKLVLKRCTRAIPISNFTKSILLSIVNTNKAHAIVSGVLERCYHYNEPTPEFRRQYSMDTDSLHVLALGRLVRRKGFDYLVQALPQCPGVTLHIAGNGPLGEELRESAKALNVQDRVVFHGFIPDEDLSTLYRTADVYAMPSRNLYRDFEGLGLTYLEAAAAGTPSIAGNNNGSVDAVLHEKTGLRVDPDSVDAIAEAMNFFVNNPDKLQEFSSHCQPFVEELSWAKVGRRYLKLIDETRKSHGK